MRVIDASATLAWVYPSERTAAIETIFENLDTQQFVVPRLWHLEVANVLLLNLRRNKYDAATFHGYMEVIGQLGIEVDEATEAHAWTATLELARLHALTVYDASYLELALRLHAPLATLDRDLRRAAAAEGVPLLGM